MKKSFILTLLLFPFLVNAQSISFDFGKSSSSFIYKDSNGDKLDNLTDKSGDILSMRYTYPLSDQFDIGMGLQKNEYGAQSLDADNNLNWDLSYVGFNLGFDYTFDLLKLNSKLSHLSYNKGLLSAVINTNFAHVWLTKGIQEIDNQVYDLKEFDGNFNNVIKLEFGVGLLFGLDDNTSLSLKYSVNRGLTNMESDNQELYLFAHHIMFGVVIDLIKN